MPKKIKELISELEKAGFVNRSGKDSDRNFIHPLVMKPVVLFGNTGVMPRNIRKKRLRRL